MLDPFIENLVRRRLHLKLGPSYPLRACANIAGLPALSLPGGWSPDGLPIGIQLIGQTGHEAGLFALARRLDAALNAYRPPA